LVVIINKLLEKKPADRYQSAKEVAELLGRCRAEWQQSSTVTSIEATAPKAIAKPIAIAKPEGSHVK